MLHLAIRGREAELRRAALNALESANEGVKLEDVLHKAGDTPRFESVQARASLRRNIVFTASQVELALTTGDVEQVNHHVGLLVRFVDFWPERWPLPVSVVHVARRFQKQAMDIGDVVAYAQPINTTSTEQPGPFSEPLQLTE